MSWRNSQLSIKLFKREPPHYTISLITKIKMELVQLINLHLEALDARDIKYSRNKYQHYSGNAKIIIQSQKTDSVVRLSHII